MQPEPVHRSSARPYFAAAILARTGLDEFGIGERGTSAAGRS